MSLRILNVAYPFAPASRDAIGGAEQILTHLDAALVEEGHTSFVMACEGSSCAGTLLESPRVPESVTERYKRAFYPLYRAAIEQAVERHSIELVHFHGVDFSEYLSEKSVPALATLHLPFEWYPSRMFQDPPRNLWFHCVSEAQQARCPSSARLLPVIRNGVDAPAGRRHARRSFVLALGRICAEKGYHIALDAARRAGVPLLLAGQVFPYEAHQTYFREELAPRFDAHRRFIGPANYKRKIRLLSAARCVLTPSLVAETSSLSSLEALACGTPVIAFRRGAMPEIIEDGVNGFLVNSLQEMADAILRCGTISREACMQSVRERYSLARMKRQYLDRYAALIHEHRNELRPGPEPVAVS